MASIKDAIEETGFSDKAIVMYILFAIPLFLCTKFLVEPDKTDYLVTTVLCTTILYLGLMIKCTQNVRASKNVVLPSFNLFSIFWDGIKGLIALTPLIIIATTLNYFISELLTKILPTPDLVNTFTIITAALCNSIVYTGYILYAKDLKISSIYNLSTISQYCVDILIAVIFMEIKLVLADALVIVPVTYIIWIFFGLPHHIATFFWCTIIVFNIAIMGHYMAQIHYETIPSDDKELF